MSKKEVPLNSLASYLPEGVINEVMHYLNDHQVHLTITRERKTVLGDYRNKWSDKNHRITVNGNLNPYAFLITLLHEIAHLLTFEKFGNKINPHGAEWKKEYSVVLKNFIDNQVFPDDITKYLKKSAANPSASSCSDTDLLRVLRKYDKGEIIFLVEDIKENELFSIKGGRIFQRGEKIRKRYKCKEVETGKIYLFSPVYPILARIN
ncbi:MAG: SprT-like domain-containing protein [Ginsengibacter sp.]